MKKVLILILILTLGLSLTGCGDEQKNGKKGLVAGENAFETGVNVKCASSEAIKIFVEPTTDELRATVEKNWQKGGMSSGSYGTIALVAGKKKGVTAELDGAFTLYVNDKSGPSVTVQVKGTYVIEELTGYDNSYFFIYTDDGLKQVQKKEWIAFKTSKVN